MNDSFKMFIIALITAVASQLLLGPYILKLQGYVPASEFEALLRAKTVAAPPRPAPAAAPTPAPAQLNAPNLEGMPVAEARERWRAKGLTIIEDGERADSGAEVGSIIEQRPAPGLPLASK
ncbi:MAG: PASTA domain-containing protein, partial [Deltaproteobacteria bacterium]|nr:PASTA domain-containing protein [Deltaproteobacteria bacterium]